MGLVSKLTFNEHILYKANKSVELLSEFRPVLPRSLLLTTYKTFARTHPIKLMLFMTKVANCHFAKNVGPFNNAELAITGAIQGSSTEKLS